LYIKLGRLLESGSVKLDFLALLQAGVLGIQKLEDFRSRLKPVQIFAARKKISSQFKYLLQGRKFQGSAKAS
jgi:hypothetical protein